MTGERSADRGFIGLRIVAGELGQCHQDPRRAIAALQTMLDPEGVLQRTERAVAAQSLDGGDPPRLGLGSEHEATARRSIVDENGTGAAHAVLAAELGAGQMELVAKTVGECRSRFHRYSVRLAVDGELDVAQLRFVSGCITLHAAFNEGRARCKALFIAWRSNRCASRCRYH